MIPANSYKRSIFLGYAAALGAAASYGSVTLVARKIVTDYSSPLVATAFSLIIGTVIVGGIFHRDILIDTPRAPKRAWVFVILSGCASTWGVAFWFLALDGAPVVLIAPLVGVHPLISIILSYLFLKRMEHLSWRVLIGAVLVVTGVALIAIGRQ